MKLTSAKMLEIMESSREYLAGELARRFDTSMAQIHDMLCPLAEEGLVHMSSHSSRIVRLQRLSFVPQPPKPLVSDMLHAQLYPPHRSPARCMAGCGTTSRRS
ncbi:hypothetical protein [Paraburkholderia sp. CNPSo 3274]|uniref:hypothetical protein n=1 Tax=Paraburkholderia sp. CNPSo 3274 TaxID=2940932 RepID=UPI0020B63811|nr:hypothetical protein [Paraburkholderia sp. CNPSo 3274]